MPRLGRVWPFALALWLLPPAGLVAVVPPAAAQEEPEAEGADGHGMAQFWVRGGRGQAVSLGQFTQEERVLSAGVALHRNPMDWGVYMHGVAMWADLGEGGFGGGLSLLRQHGWGFSSRYGLGMARLSFQAPGYALQHGPALHAVVGVDAHLGWLTLSVEGNGLQGAGWSLDGGQSVLYPSRWSVAWLGGLSF